MWSASGKGNKIYMCVFKLKLKSSSKIRISVDKAILLASSKFVYTMIATVQLRESFYC